MELFHLKLSRLTISNYRSIKYLGLDSLGPLVCLTGRNDAGKSNLLDAIQFLSDATLSLDHALASRGREFSQIVHRKKAELKIEFQFEFTLAADKRAEMLQQLFADNPAAPLADLQASDFLTALLLKVVVARDQFTEELSARHLRGAPPWPIFSIRGTPKRTDLRSGQLDTVCQSCKEQIPSTVMPADLPPETGQPFRLRLGRPDAAADLPVSFELAQGVRQQFDALGAEAGTLATSDTRQPALAADNANLAEVLHWVYNNKPAQFRRIEAHIHDLVPRLGRLQTPTVQKNTILALADSRDDEVVYSQSQIGAGARQVIALVSRVMLAPPGAWIRIEEPETHLHPAAQTKLMHFLRAEAASRRLFFSTHAPAIAAACPVASLFLVRRDAENNTSAQAVTPVNAAIVANDLGVVPTFSFDCDAVVFVERADYVPVYETWAKKFSFRIGVQFLACDGGDTLRFFANARIAMSRWVRTSVLAVFGNGSNEIRKSISQSLQLEEDQIVTMDFPELEGGLLDPKAIRKAFSTITLSEEELQARLDPALVLLNQRKALSDLLAEFKLGEYDGQLGSRIAECMEVVPPDVLQLFRKIEARTKPYWEI